MTQMTQVPQLWSAAPHCSVELTRALSLQAGAPGPRAAARRAQLHEGHRGAHQRAQAQDGEHGEAGRVAGRRPGLGGETSRAKPPGHAQR